MLHAQQMLGNWATLAPVPPKHRRKDRHNLCHPGKQRQKKKI